MHFPVLIGLLAGPPAAGGCCDVLQMAARHWVMTIVCLQMSQVTQFVQLWSNSREVLSVLLSIVVDWHTCSGGRLGCLARWATPVVRWSAVIISGQNVNELPAYLTKGFL